MSAVVEILNRHRQLAMHVRVLGCFLETGVCREKKLTFDLCSLRV